MKLIKKIAAIMFAFMMVVSMSCNVKAEDGASPKTTGTLTINHVKEKQTYKLYKILDLESFSGNNYSYKVAQGWEDFFSTGEGKNYISINENNYANWSASEDDATYRIFAQKALEYANSKTLAPTKTYETIAGHDSITDTGLALGYYLLDSSVGTLCSLSSSKPNVTIDEKNDVPSVEKKVYKGNNLEDSNNANIGDTVTFQTTIHVKKGAQKYVLHDVLSNGLKLKKDVNPIHNTPVYVIDSDHNVLNNGNNNDYTFKETDDGFTITFTDTYLKSKEDKDYTLIVTYSAILTDAAVIGGTGNTNETYLKYGVGSESNHSTTTTKTFEMNVFKFYKDKKNSDKETGLADAVFTLSKKSDGTEPIKLIDKSSNVYRVAKTDETNTITEVITPDNGRFTIQGLGAGTYYLTETKQPAGYNKLSGPVTVVIDETGLVKVGESEANPVKVLNKTGTVLPSTGGAGTTMIYLIGGALVLGSGVVLVTKRRVKNK